MVIDLSEDDANARFMCSLEKFGERDGCLLEMNRELRSNPRPSSSNTGKEAEWGSCGEGVGLDRSDELRAIAWM
jgi:hypothetical protein